MSGDPSAAMTLLTTPSCAGLMPSASPSPLPTPLPTPSGLPPPSPPCSTGQTVITEGRCGPHYGGQVCSASGTYPCCSSNDWCGSTAAHCGAGFQPAYSYGTQCGAPPPPSPIPMGLPAASCLSSLLMLQANPTGSVADAAYAAICNDMACRALLAPPIPGRGSFAGPQILTCMCDAVNNGA
jgi:hypothetical protein